MDDAYTIPVPYATKVRFRLKTLDVQPQLPESMNGGDARKASNVSGGSSVSLLICVLPGTNDKDIALDWRFLLSMLYAGKFLDMCMLRCCAILQEHLVVQIRLDVCCGHRRRKKNRLDICSSSLKSTIVYIQRRSLQSEPEVKRLHKVTPLPGTSTIRLHAFVPHSRIAKCRILAWKASIYPLRG